MQTLIKKLTRFVVMTSVFFLPPERKREVERWVRGREQWKKLRRANAVVVSFGKSGRTWLRVMLSGFYQVKHGLPQRALIGFDNLHRKNRSIPKVFFTHDNYLKDYTGHGRSKEDYRGHKVVLLVRHPGDVAVSQYHQWRYRMKPNKKTLNEYPPEGTEVPIFDFVARERAGLDKVIEFMNDWAAEIATNDDVLVVRYEDMRERPGDELRRILEFLGTPGDEEQIRAAVEYASFDNMRQMETGRTFWLSGGRMVPKDRKNPNSFKTRRGKVGGWRDYFDEAEAAEVEEIVQKTLAPVYGYGDKGGPSAAEGGAA